MLTNNEKKLLRYLLANFYRDSSINQAAKECGLSPNGAYKILKKLEKDNVTYFKEIGKIKAYKLNFDNSLILSYLEIALNDKRINEAKIKVRAKDLEVMKDVCKAVALFGSYISEKKNPNDIDILFVFESNNFKVLIKN